jgi:hypothetical protein
VDLVHFVTFIHVETGTLIIKIGMIIESTAQERMASITFNCEAITIPESNKA